jgi:hypothetical protein
MIPKGKLLALLLAFTAVGGLAATGAFTTVQAERTAEVSTAGDSNALVQIEPASGTEFADTGSNDNEVQIDLDGNENTDQDPGGVNIDAQTLDDGVLTVTNNGNGPVTISATAATSSDATIEFYVADSEVVDGTTEEGTTLKNSDVSNVPTSSSGNRYIVNSQGNGITINSGNSVTLGLYISVADSFSDGSNVQLFDGDDPVTITADATTDPNGNLNATT